ncbi:MAG: tetratricopeptide repeat protein [Planctomycetota bacterium]
MAILVLVLVSTGEVIATAQQNTPPGRLRVAILGFANETGNPEASHWRCGIERLLSSDLRKIKAIKLASGVEYAQRQLGVGKNESLKPEQARKMGELIEAQRVVWGEYYRQNELWRVSAHVLNVASGKASDELISTSADWFELRDELTQQILGKLGIKPSEPERQKMGRRWTSSTEALEWYCWACVLQDEDKPLSEQENSARKAIATDPQFAMAHFALASILAMKGEFPQAEQAAHQAMSLRPDFAGAYRILAVLSLHTNKYTEAEQQLYEAHRLDPDDTRVLIRLAELSFVRRRWDEAIAFAEKARILDPTDAPVHALLGFLYTFKGGRDKAMVELKEAIRLDPEGQDVAQRAAQAYERMREVPLAIEHYERFVTQIKELGGDPRAIRVYEEITKHLKASLTPTFIEAAMPKIYTKQSLQDALQERLTEDELAMVVNPIASSEEMKRWAEQLTEGTVSDLDKARALFEGLMRRIELEGERQQRTAREVFAAWDEPEVSFVCQEYAKLFVALARDVNLPAFYVHVDKDYSGRTVPHDCAAVFIDGRALFVDPSYQWFGVPHKDFVILDDLHTIAHHFFQPTNTDWDVSRCQLAAKLHPDSAWGQLKLFRALYKAEQWDEARAALDTASQLEPNRWDVYLWQGAMADHDGNWEEALSYAQKSLESNPESAVAHYLSARLLTKIGKLKEARDEFRAGLRYGPQSKMAEVARRAIAQINEEIGVEHNEIETNEGGNNHLEGDN